MNPLPLVVCLSSLLLTLAAYGQSRIELSEFMASNANGIRDGYGLTSDWIEIFNGETNGLDLTGWHLTDEPTNLTKWTFPPTPLPAGKYLVLFASGQGLPDPAGRLHANFKLPLEGGYLALVEPDGVTIRTEYRPNYPLQRDDFSYGRVPLNSSNSLNGVAFFLKPTPGSNNSPQTVLGFVDGPQFSLKRGFLSAPTDIVIHSPTPGATLIVTTNGSIPNLTNGLRFLPQDEASSVTATSRVSTTTLLRAASYKSGFQPSRIDTHTYLFLNDVIRQPANPPGFPRDWNGTLADYAMDQRVVTNAAYRNEIVQDMRSIPTLSIVVNPVDLFSNTRGFYSLSENSGDAWERAASVELIETDGSSGFQEDCGIRIWGTGWRPHSSSLKHALQLKFQDQYGPRKLTYPLFKDAPVREFDNVVLRAQGSRSWSDFRTPDIEQTQFIHDAWARDTRRDMGTVDGHATFVHLYLNGLYWGLYNPVEKTDEGFAEAYYGGDKPEYDVISRRFEAEAQAGNLTEWRNLWAIVRKGPVNAERYAQIQQYLDVEDLIDYMLLNQYATNHDGPTHNGNNLRAIRRRIPGAPFRFYVWDMEYTMWYAQENNLSVTVPETPAELFQWLRKQAEFRQLYADHAHRHLFGSGALTAQAAGARWLARAEEIYGAVVGESARWGDARRPAQPYTRNIEWQAELNRLMQEFFPQRTEILIHQLREAGLYPSVEAPSFEQPAGAVAPGFALSLDAPAGTIVYTTDGTDPRLPGGTVSPGSTSFVPTTVLVSNSAPAKVWIPADAHLGEGWTQSGSAFDDSAWLSTSSPIGFDASPAPTPMKVDLRNPTADHSESGRAIGLALDTNTTSTGWALFQPDFVNKSRGAVAVFETVTNVDFPEGTLLTFQLKHGQAGGGSLGKFRLSVTTDAPDTFADGLPSRGDVVANWTSLKPISATSTGGATFTVNPNNTVLVSGKNASTDTFTVIVITSLRNLTGFRLEAFEDTSLPNRGPGRGSQGNVLLTDFSVQAAPATLTTLLQPAETLAVANAMLGRNSSAYIRFPFTIDSPARLDELSLRIRYEDGFVCYLNGHEVARRNAPATLSWNSAAAGDRDRAKAFEAESIDLTAAVQYLQPGANLLAFQALNDSPSSSDFLLQPELIAKTRAPVIIDHNVTIKTRVLLNGEWSALAEAFYSTRSPVRITEIHYNPPGDGPFSGDEFEFVELQNTSASRFNASGLYVSEGIDFRFQEGAWMEPGELWVLVRNPVQFARRYPGVAIHGTYTGKLDNGGETLSISGSGRGILFSVSYSDSAPWPAAADGYGFSLVLRNPADLSTSPGSESWRASKDRLGSPGAVDPDPGIPEIWITEVISNPAPGGSDTVELYNPTSGSVDIGGWFLTDDRANPKKFRIPQGTLISPKGYLLFDERALNPDPLSPTSFLLDAEGDSVYLFSGNASGELTGYSDGFAFEVSPPGGSFGRFSLSTGKLEFPLQSSTSLGRANSGPLTGPLVITEISYHPVSGGIEFIELENISSQTVNLFDAAFPTNRWIVNGIDFTFPPGSSLSPGNLAVVVGQDPEAFREAFAVPPSVQVFGPFSGTLQDSGELIELMYPLTPSIGGVNYVVADAVRYGDRAPWPSAADGRGPSLQRAKEITYGNDPIHWIAGAPTPGRPYASGTAPWVGTQPPNRTLLVGDELSLEVAAAGQGPILYQWHFAGTNLPNATNALLILPNVQQFQAGAYSVTVYNAAGSTLSSEAVVEVLQPPVITLQPASRTVGAGSNVTLASGGMGTGPVFYQWQFNGEDLPGATSATLVLSRVQESNSGAYRLVIRDSLASAASQTAIIQVIVSPRMITPPQSVVAVEGQSVSLLVRVEGTLPLSYRWRSNGLTLINLISDAKTSVLNVGPFKAGFSADFSVTITNRFGPKLDSAPTRVTVLADSDGDQIPDEWEIANRMDPKDPADALLDRDGDKMTSVDEFIAGTDPSDPASVLAGQFLWQESVFSVGFLAMSNRAYSIQYVDRLDDPIWLYFADIVAHSTNRSVTLPDAEKASNRYYRIVTPIQP